MSYSLPRATAQAQAESGATAPHSKPQRVKGRFERRPRFGVRQCSAAFNFYEGGRYAPRLKSNR